MNNVFADKIIKLSQIYLTIAFLIIIVFIQGCSAPVEDLSITEDNYIIIGGKNLNNPNFVKKELYGLYQEWKGTRYRNGGLDKRGIDCSGLVYITFKYRFGIVLPRTTEDMVKLGINIDLEECRPGDLIFFKTGLFDRHVGVYIEDGQFLHASTSQGVIISKLYNPYWSKTYWTAKRI
ncbi:NLP/P60 protein [Candidatus Magnetoovum chiemensis]|nr:NLP/P60 protein [Candidatus Magnetoovum chiemensis]